MSEPKVAATGERPVITDQDLARIVSDLAHDGVWVDPSFARTHDLSAADEQQLVRAVAGLERPVRVVLVEPSYDDPEYQGQVEMLVHALTLADEVPSLYVVPSHGGDRSSLLNELDARTDSSVIGLLASQRHPDEFLAQTLETIALTAQPQRVVEQAYRDSAPRTTSQSGAQPSREPEGASVWQISGLLVGLVAVVMVGAALWRAFVRRRTQYRPSGALLRRAKSAEQRSRRQVAEAEVTTLAEAVARASAELPGTQVALDHLEAAQRALALHASGARGEADVIGALILAQRGHAALQGRPLGTRCWFNPLHPVASDEVQWRHDGRAVTVPTCAACGAQVARGQEPSDILDLAGLRATRHWFHLDLGPWTTTGFGAFTPDLPHELTRSGAFDD